MRFGGNHKSTRQTEYGRYEGKATMISSVIGQMLQGKKHACTLGEQMWDYLYAVDAGRALCLLEKYGIHGKIYCVGSGKGKTPQRIYRIDLQSSQLNFGDWIWGVAL